MTIAYYTDQTYQHGGLERVLSNKINYLSAKDGIIIHMITSEQKGQANCYPMNKEVIFHDLGIQYDRKRSFFHPTNILRSFGHFFKLKKALQNINPDIIVVCNYDYAFYLIPFLAKRALKIKEYHSSRHFSFLSQQQNKSMVKNLSHSITKYFESKYDYLALLTHDELDYYQGNNKIVIPNALVQFPNKKALLMEKKAISAGRIAPVKGFEMLISSWKSVAAEFPDWRLEIYGNGEDEYIENLNRKIIDLDLQQHIFLMGATDHLEDVMINASLFVMSSITECFPMVLLEALSCGLPIVSFDCPNGPRNIIENKVDGVLVESGNCEAMAKSIIDLISNPGKRKEMGKNGRKKAQKYSQETIMKKWLNVFGNV